MLMYIAGIAILFVVVLGAAILKKTISTTTNCEYECNSMKRKLRVFANFFVASLIAVCMVFISFSSIREYFLSILPEQTISSAYSVINVLFGAPSVTYALNSLCIYFVIGSSVSAVCVISVNIIANTLLVGSDAGSSTSENELKSVVKISFFDRISFISLRRIRI